MYTLRGNGTLKNKNVYICKRVPIRCRVPPFTPDFSHRRLPLGLLHPTAHSTLPVDVAPWPGPPGHVKSNGIVDRKLHSTKMVSEDHCLA